MELIGFSNKYFYKPKGKELIILNSNYLTYKDTNRLMVIHPVKVDGEKEISDKINVSEAETILKFFRELKSDKRYRDKFLIYQFLFFHFSMLKLPIFVNYLKKRDIKKSRTIIKLGLLKEFKAMKKMSLFIRLLFEHQNKKINMFLLRVKEEISELV